MEDYFVTSSGQFYTVDGDYQDKFLIIIRWNGTVTLYHQDSEILRFMDFYESVYDLIEKYPAFSCIDPSTLREKYMKLKYPVIHTPKSVSLTNK